MSIKNKIHEFEAVIQAADGGGAFIHLPFDVEKEYGKKRLKVKASFDGVGYQGTVVRYGSPEYILIVRKDIRKKISKAPGDTVSVVLQEDLAPRKVTIPTDFQKLMTTEPSVLAFFQKLSYTYQKEYIQWIEAAKRPETRQRRMEKAILQMKSGKKGI